METNNKILDWPSFEKWLSFPGEQIKKVFRWGKFLKRSKRQNTLEHTLQQTLLTVIALFIENPEQAKKDPFFMVTACALLHDFGERTKRNKKIKKWAFDDAATEKVGNNGEKIQNGERKRVYDFLDKLPLAEPAKSQTISFLIDCYEIQYDLDTELGKYFNLLERLGYFLHAIDECRAGNTEYKEVFISSDYKRVYSSKFKSITSILKPYLEEIKNYLK